MKQNEKRNYKWRMVEMSNETVITADNVKCIGEILALQALKTTIAYTGKTLHKLYQGLVHDILRSETCTDAFSDGYDLAQTAILFLCEHMGKKLGDIVGTNRYGRPTTLTKACYNAVDYFVFHQHVIPQKHFVSLYDDIVVRKLEEQERYVPNEDDYAALDAKMARMHLNQGEKEVLDSYMSGIGHLETARYLNVHRVTVWKRRNRIREKYIKTFGTH